MLDLDHPRTAHVFAASRQVDLILDCCKIVTLSGERRRRFMLEVMRPAFAALRWLADHHFSDRTQIMVGIAEWESQVENLAGLGLKDSDLEGGQASQCPACDGKATTPSKYDPRAYCSVCLGIIQPGLTKLRSSDRGFGIDAI